MDAPGEQDIKLQRTSAELLADFQSLLLRCIQRSIGQKKQLQSTDAVSNTVKQAHLNRLVGLLEPFQEWPQLLDPHLASLLPPITTALVTHIGPCKGVRTKLKGPTLSSTRVLLRYALCKLLYTFCKVRGHKVISCFFDNDPKRLEPLLLALNNKSHNWRNGSNSSEVSGTSLTWEERYVMLLWLSHLLLVPFDLKVISSAGTSDPSVDLRPGLNLAADVPWPALRLVDIGLGHLGVPGKERESARTLLVRLSTRSDMCKVGLLQDLVKWILNSLDHPLYNSSSTLVYEQVGFLSYLAAVLTCADRGAVSGLLQSIFQTAQKISSDDSPFYVDLRSTALARKALIKLYRNLTCVVLETSHKSSSAELLHALLEDVIDHLLTALSDKDTPVRYASSKAIAVITMKLEQTFARDIVGAILGSMSENLSWNDSYEEDRKSREIRDMWGSSNRPSFAAVNPLQWHGLTLALANLLFHRSPPPDQLPEIIDLLVLALQFEQRSSTGTSLGTNVRDAACFGIWALSRKYSTDELLAINISTLRVATCYGAAISTIQMLATELVVAASLDPVGNIRRGASAALQELIGRHPDQVTAGISLVQTVDYHAVALRSKAITEVGLGASRLGLVYWNALVDGSMHWRGLASSDSQSRRTAAQGLCLLSTAKTGYHIPAHSVVNKLAQELISLQLGQYEERHGMLLALSGVLDAQEVYLSSLLGKEEDTDNDNDSSSVAADDEGLLWRMLQIIDTLSGQVSRSSLRSELIAESSCRFVASLARMIRRSAKDKHYSFGERPNKICTLLTRCIELLLLALRCTDDIVLGASGDAARALFAVLEEPQKEELVRSWVSFLQREKTNLPGAIGQRPAYIHALGAVYSSFHTKSSINLHSSNDKQAIIIRTLAEHAGLESPIEVRIESLKSLSLGVLSSEGFCADIVRALKCCLDDYTIDSRGDIGSRVRLEAIDAVTTAANHNLLGGTFQDGTVEGVLVSSLARLSVEKLDKVRLQASACLKQVWRQLRPSSNMANLIRDSSEISSYHYFLGILKLLVYEEIAWVRDPIIEGYAASAGAGSESVIQASRRALVDFTEDLPADRTGGSFSLEDLCIGIVRVIRSPNNDRNCISAMEVLAFLLDARALDPLFSMPFDWSALFDAIQKSHYKSGKVQKLETAVKVYAGLTKVSTLRKAILRKLTSLLRHPFAKVRVVTAEALYMVFTIDGLDDGMCRLLLLEQWSSSAKQTKGTVDQIMNYISALAD